MLVRKGEERHILCLACPPLLIYIRVVSLTLAQLASNHSGCHSEGKADTMSVANHRDMFTLGLLMDGSALGPKQPLHCLLCLINLLPDYNCSRQFP